MNYESIDPIISAWADKYSLYVYMKYRDEEVRSVNLVNSNGRKCQLWIDLLEPNGIVRVHVWDYKKHRQDYAVAVNSLPACLEDAYVVATNWLKTD